MSSTALGCASSLTNISHGGLYIIYIPLEGLLNPYNARNQNQKGKIIEYLNNLVLLLKLFSTCFNSNLKTHPNEPLAMSTPLKVNRNFPCDFQIMQ